MLRCAVSRWDNADRRAAAPRSRQSLSAASAIHGAQRRTAEEHSSTAPYVRAAPIGGRCSGIRTAKPRFPCLSSLIWHNVSPAHRGNKSRMSPAQQPQLRRYQSDLYVRFADKANSPCEPLNDIRIVNQSGRKTLAALAEPLN